MNNPTAENTELRTQAIDALRSSGVPINPEHFPRWYHHQALLRACPSIPTPRGQIFARIEQAWVQTYMLDSFESFQANLAGALIHLMFIHPAACLKAMHNPEAREIFELAAAFDWEAHVQTMQQNSTANVGHTQREEI
jgi:hypothetical protein